MENKISKVPEVTLSEAAKIVTALAPTQSVMLLSSPGVGKSAVVEQAARAAGLECRSLLGTQIAPEDVSGIPRIVGERSVFCPPRVLLPEDPHAKPFCLFLDELPACSPDIQKAFYSLLLERRVGEYPLPKGTWVVAAGNRAEDRSLVRSLSAALVNRVAILNVRVSVKEWLAWAAKHGVRHEVVAFITYAPESLQRPVPATPSPFSTPRAWASFAQALDCLERAGSLTSATRKALAFGMLSPEDAAAFSMFAEYRLESLRPWYEYLKTPGLLPRGGAREDQARRFFVLSYIRKFVASGRRLPEGAELSTGEVNAFLSSLSKEDRILLLLDQVEAWAKFGADEALAETFEDLVGPFL